MAEIDLEAAIERARKRAAEKAGGGGPTADAAPDAEAGDIPAPEFDLDERLRAARQRVLDKGGTVGREPPAEPTMGRGQDFGLSLGTGLQEGVTKLPGIVGDLQKTIHDKVQDWTGLDTSKIPALNPAMVPLGFGKQMPTGEDIQNKYTELTRGRYTHEPQYDTGEYGKEIGEFMPNFLGGPVGGARGAALKLGTRVVGPALATKSLGDLADEYLPESWAPTVKTGIAALSGGAGIAGEELAAGKSLRAAKEGIPGRAAPTGKEIHAASESQYDEFAKSPVRIKKGTTNIFGMNLETTLKNKGFFDTPTSAPTVHATVRHFLKNADAPMTALEWKEARKALGQSAFKGIGSERAAGAMAIKHLDAWWKDLKQRQLAQGSIKDLDVSKKLLEKANENYGAYQRDLAYQRLINKGKRQAGAAYSGMNVDNSLRGKFRTMLDKEESSRALNLSPEEFQQAEGVAAGSPAANRARKVGNLGGGGMGIGTGLLGLGSLGPAYFLDPKFALALTLPAAGIGARMRANRLTESAARSAQENLRRRSPLAESLPRPHVRTPKDELWERAMILAELQRLNAGKAGE